MEKDIHDQVIMDLHGPMRVESFNKNVWLLTISDYSTRMVRPYFLKHKNESFTAFKQYAAYAKQHNPEWKVKHINIYSDDPENPLKSLRSDGDSCFTEGEFQEWMLARGISHEMTTRGSSQDNPKAETLGRFIQDVARTLMLHANLGGSAWEEACRAACYLRNRIWHSAIGMTPYEKWFHCKPNLSNLKTWGCVCYRKPPKEELTRWDDQGLKCLMLGYDDYNPDYYRVYDLTKRAVIREREIYLSMKNASRVGTSHFHM